MTTPSCKTCRFSEEVMDFQPMGGKEIFFLYCHWRGEPAGEVCDRWEREVGTEGPDE